LRSALDSLGRVDDPELRRRLAEVANHDVRRLDRLVTEIADASRVEAEMSRTAFEPIDLDELIANVLEARGARGQNGDHPVALHREGHEPALVLGVPMRLERVIANLLDNAVSFSPPGERIDVTVRASGGRVETIVCDRGPGIPDSEREKVFARFHSVRPEAESFGDHSGLGLAIARTIAEAHDGTLTVRDRADGATGACLVLDLPCAA
jgi:two-component system sensor histidine kinase ChvG